MKKALQLNKDDEDYELLLELAMLRDANNEKVRRAAMEKEALKSMYDDAERFSFSIEEQIRLIEEELSHYDLEYTMRKREEQGIAIGEERGIAIGEERGLEQGLEQGIEQGLQ